MLKSVLVVYLQIEGASHTKKVKESEGNIEICVELRNAKKNNLNLSVSYTITESVPENQGQCKMKYYSVI